MASEQMSGALLSCLGFPGWGGLHLIVPSRGDPAAMALRLGLSAADSGNGSADPWPGAAGLLLPALLRQHRDLEPLNPALWPWAREASLDWPREWRHRYLLVCRWGYISRCGSPPVACRR